MQNWNFVRLFETATTVSDADLTVLVRTMRADQQNASGIPAGYTYFGQFLAHDLSELRRSSRFPERDPAHVKDLEQMHRPALDLSSLYGGGLDDSIVTYERQTGKFVLGETENGKRRDLFRRPDGMALIADARNDENLLVAQMHVLFMRFHNRLIDFYTSRSNGNGSESGDVFRRARSEAIASYQWIAMHDFARQILPEKVYEHVVCNRRGALLPRGKSAPAMPVEFSGAAFRFGHSMIKEKYKLTGTHSPSVELEDLLQFTGKFRLGNGVLLPEEMIVDWGMFFRFRDHAGWGERTGRAVNQALRINTSITKAMRHLVRDFGDADIIDLNLRRGRELGLATGQEICDQLRDWHPQLADDVGLDVMKESRLFDNLPRNSLLKRQTPLWAYVLSEAHQYVRERGAGVLATLGTLGGWLVADGLSAAVHYAQDQVDKAWSPDVSVINQVLGWRKKPALRNELTLEDLIVFTYPDDH